MTFAEDSISAENSPIAEGSTFVENSPIAEGAARAEGPNAAVEFDAVSFAYQARSLVLDNVSLRIAEGEFVCIVGSNGSGKSTLARHMNALLPPGSGRVTVFGRDTADSNNTFPIRNDVAMVFQNPDEQLVSSIVEDDVAFGPENLGLDPDEVRDRVSEALARVGLSGFEKLAVQELSGGQKQRVAIAGALAMKPRLVVFDEAASMLDRAGRRDFRGICEELRDAGITIVSITHDMDEAVRADRVIVLDEGAIALDGAPDDVLVDADVLERLSVEPPFAVRLRRALLAEGVSVGSHVRKDSLVDELRERFRCGLATAAVPATSNATAAAPATDAAVPATTAAAPAASNATGTANVPVAPASSPSASSAPSSPVVEFSNVSFAYQPARFNARFWGSGVKEASAVRAFALKGVSFKVVEGEMLGIAGHTGSGKSTLAQLVAGLLKPDEGTVTAGPVGIAFQYPEQQLFSATVFDDVAFGPRNSGLGEERVEEVVRSSCEAVHLDFEHVRDLNPFSLSQGQQRCVALAGVLAMQSNVLVLDEPFAGLDFSARASFESLLGDLRARQGLTVILVSHDLDYLLRAADRVLVLNQGEVHALGAPVDVLGDGEDLRAIGLDVPDALDVADALGVIGKRNFDLGCLARSIASVSTNA